MKVDLNCNDGTVRLGEISIGDTFAHKGNYYMRVTGAGETAYVLAGVELDTGRIIYFNYDDMITPIALKVVRDEG